MALLASEEGLEQNPLFIDYGQLCADREWDACCRVLRTLNLPKPRKMGVGGFGRTIPSGITNRRLRVNEDAFLPGRNLLFLLCGASYAYTLNAGAVAIGLLSDQDKIFPDQSEAFVRESNRVVNLALGRKVRFVAPLMGFTKRDILMLARDRGISGTYSCHTGGRDPCGECVSCREVLAARHRPR
jgi:7-cyano-7-deazaguanine synthase